MLKYYKVIENNYITAIGINIEGVEIDKSEYDDLLNIIRNKPAVLNGYDYRLNTNLEWDSSVVYSEAVDPAEFNRTYTETDVPIEVID